VGHTAKTAFDWPDYVADALGFFSAAGLKTDIIVVGSAAAAAQQLTAGAIDLGEISTTQAIEAVEGGAPITSVISLISAAPYSILGKKGVESLAGLRGKTLIVGGPNDVTRVFADRVLASAGLRSDDVTYVFAGTTGERFAALLSGTVDGAILGPPFSFRAKDMGYPTLAEVPKFFPHFMQGVFMARTEWAQKQAELLSAYLRAHLAAVRWLYAPANQRRAIEILAQATNTPLEDAAKTYEYYIVQLKFFPPTGHIAAEQFRQIELILAQTKQLQAPLAAPEKYFDNRYVDQAWRELGRQGK
jgi:NitT/TauT family transport system substrate-binding protein